MRTLAGAAVLVFAGCPRTPEYQYRDAGDGSCTLMERTSQAVTWSSPTLGAADFELNFQYEDDPVSAFPVSIRVGSTADILGAFPDQPPPEEEKGVGVGFYPAATYWGRTTSAMHTSAFAGPFVGQVRAAWTGIYTCSTPSGPRTVTGVSTYTGFPDGRVVRRDEFGSDASCTLTSVYITSFTTLGVGIGTTLYTDGAPETGEQSMFETACLEREGSYAAGFGWPDPSTRLRLAPDAVAFVYDRVANGTSIPAGTLAPVTTTMFLSSDATCADLEDRLEAQLARPALSANGVTLTLGDDGIYRQALQVPLDASGAEFVELSAGGATAVGRGIAVLVDFGVDSPTLAVSRDTATCGDDWFGVQRTAGTVHLVWLSSGLAPGERITIRQAP